MLSMEDPELEVRWLAVPMKSSDMGGTGHDMGGNMCDF